LSKATAAAGFKSVLVGEGADELFCGYSHLVRDYLMARASSGDSEATASLGHLEEQARLQSGVMFPAGEVADTPSFVGLELLPTAVVAKLETGRRMCRFLRDEFVAASSTRHPMQDLIEDSSVGPELVGRHPVDQAAIVWMRSALSGYILKTLGDGTEMAHSIEGRVPFLDHKLFERARRIPPESKLRGGVAKSILRRSLAGLLPEKLCQRPKQPLLAPPISGHRSEGWTLALDLVHSQSFRRQPFWDASHLGAWMSTLHQADESTRRQADPIVMLALSSHALQQAFGLSGDIHD
jgi:asparagine synthase (glutamine-hydrolysing)